MKKTRTAYMVMLDLSDKPVVNSMRLRQVPGRYPWNEESWALIGKQPNYSTYASGDIIDTELLHDTREQAIKAYELDLRTRINEFMDCIEKKLETLNLVKGLRPCQE